LLGGTGLDTTLTAVQTYDKTSAVALGTDMATGATSTAGTAVSGNALSAQSFTMAADKILFTSKNTLANTAADATAAGVVETAMKEALGGLFTLQASGWSANGSTYATKGALVQGSLSLMAAASAIAALAMAF